MYSCDRQIFPEMFPGVLVSTFESGQLGLISGNTLPAQRGNLKALFVQEQSHTAK